MSSRTVPEVCSECGADLELVDTSQDTPDGSFVEQWYCETCDRRGTIEGMESLPPQTFAATGVCRD